MLDSCLSDQVDFDSCESISLDITCFWNLCSKSLVSPCGTGLTSRLFETSDVQKLQIVIKQTTKTITVEVGLIRRIENRIGIRNRQLSKNGGNRKKREYGSSRKGVRKS